MRLSVKEKENKYEQKYIYYSLGNITLVQWSVSIVNVHRVNEYEAAGEVCWEGPSYQQVRGSWRSLSCRSSSRSRHEVEEMLQSSRSRLECEDQLLGHIFKSFLSREASRVAVRELMTLHTYCTRSNILLARDVGVHLHLVALYTFVGDGLTVYV